MKDIFNNEKNTLIDTTPLKGGGASFATRKLVEMSPSRYEFKSTVGAILFSLLFIIFPLASTSFFVDFFINHAFLIEVVENPTIVLPMLVPVIFIVAGVAMLFYFSRPVVFDKSVGFFWKGFRQPSTVYSRNKRKKAVRIEEIRGLQIVKELVHAKNSYTSYELNLVLNNSERINVTDHGNLQKTRKDARKLAEFLNVSMWDTTLQN